MVVELVRSRENPSFISTTTVRGFHLPLPFSRHTVTAATSPAQANSTSANPFCFVTIRRPSRCLVQAYSEKFSSTIPGRIRRLGQPNYWATAAVPLKLLHLLFGPGDLQRGAGAPTPHLSPSSRAREITRGEALCRLSTTARASTATHSPSSSRDDQYAKYGASVLRRITSATAPGPPSTATSGDQAPHLRRDRLAS